MDEPTTFDTYAREKNNVASDRFWYEDWYILFHPDRAMEMVPTVDMSTNEKLNAISRFLIYFSILLFMVFRNYNLFFIPIIGMFILWVVFHNDKKLQTIKAENFDQDVKAAFDLPPDMLIGVDDMGNVCKRPTGHNPFMNITMDEYTTQPNRPPPCSWSDPDIKDEIEKGFNYNLYKNVDDVWDRNNSQRQFVTLPGQTIPNDRDSFQRWLYGQRGVCKDGDQEFCLQNEDLRVPGYS